MLVEFIPSKFMKICKMVITGIQYIEVTCTVTKLLHWKPHIYKVLQELQGTDSTVKVWFYKWFWEQGVLVKLIHYSLLLQVRLLT